MLTDRLSELRQCPAHGEYLATQYLRGTGPFWTGCNKCQAEEWAELQAEGERQLAEERQDRRFAASGLLGRFRSATFDSYAPTTPAQKSVLASCKKFAEKLSSQAWGGPWLIGPPGTGKTHLGSAMVHAAILAGHYAHIDSARNIVRRLRATWAKGSAESEQNVLDDLTGTGLLVIDEIGVGFGSEAETTQLFDVIDRRYQLCRPVVLLSNLNLPNIKTALGDRLYDRMREGFQVLVCDWPSHRGAAS